MDVKTTVMDRLGMMFTEFYCIYTLNIIDSSSLSLYLDIDQLFNPYLFSVSTWAWTHHTHTQTHTHMLPIPDELAKEKMTLKRNFKNIQIAI